MTSQVLDSASTFVSSLVQVARAIGIIYVIYAFGRFLKKRQPGDSIAPTPPNALSMAVASFWPPPGWPMHPTSHFIPHERAGKTILSLIWPFSGKRFILVADQAAIKRIFSDRHTWVKMTEAYELMAFFGPNIVTTEGDDWVRHRSLTRKSFGERNNALLWIETISSLNEWFDDWDSLIATDPTSSIVVNMTEAMRDVTLAIIASAGFGIHFGRRTSSSAETEIRFESNKPRTGFQMSFAEALYVAIETMITKVITPRLFYSLPIKSLQKSDTAYDELRRYISSVVEESRHGKRSEEESADLSRRLIEANDGELEDARHRLSDDELVSNIYAFFVAGHETTAHTLTFAWALLAIHPDIQEKVYQEVELLWPDLNDGAWTNSTLDDLSHLDYAIAVFRETLRLYPAAVITRRTATRDTVLPCETRNAQTGVWEAGEIMAEQGLEAMINIHGLHMNPQYWGPDVNAFRPERFIDRPEEGYQWPRDAWVPFTSGPHVCLGQRFAIVEGACILARLLRRYRIRPTSDIAKLPHAEQWAKLTAWTLGVTATPGQVNLVVEPRHTEQAL